MAKKICINPYCDFCLDLKEFEGDVCPNCKGKEIQDVSFKKYLNMELLNQLRIIREEEKQLKDNIINPNKVAG